MLSTGENLQSFLMSWKVEKRAPQVKYAACDHLSLAISTPNSCVVFARFFNRERNLRVGLYLFIEIKRQLKNIDSLIS